MLVACLGFRLTYDIDILRVHIRALNLPTACKQNTLTDNHNGLDYNAPEMLHLLLLRVVL